MLREVECSDAESHQTVVEEVEQGVEQHAEQGCDCVAADGVEADVE